MCQYILYKIAGFLAVSLPAPVKYWIAYRIADLYLVFHKQCRQAVYCNLKNINFPEGRFKTTVKVFRSFSKYLADFLFIAQLNESNWSKLVTTMHEENFDNAYKEGKGVIALTAHLGNWELGGIVLSLMGYPTSAIVLPQKNGLVNSFFLEQRHSKKLKSIPLGPYLKECFKRLKSGEVVAILGDRNIGLIALRDRSANNKNGVEVEFFGRKAYFPKGPAVLAYWTQAVILPGFTVRGEDNKYTLYFEKPIPVTRCGNKEEFIKINTQKMASVIEKYVAMYYEQWCVFEKVWKE